MILVRSPLRITLGGGGTDFESYYSKVGGNLISAAINKYVYVSILTPFIEKFFLKYSKLEIKNAIEDLEHPIIRETLKTFGPHLKQIEITTLADIPAGTGLGSSGSFTTALILALNLFNRSNVFDKKQLAEAAYDIEFNRLKQPVGKQDQYIAAYGGLTNFNFKKNGFVDVTSLNISDDKLNKLESNLLLFFTGYSRNASDILNDQDKRSRNNDKEMFKNLDYVKELGNLSKVAIISGNLEEFGKIMNEHWLWKLKRSPNMSLEKINEWYQLGLKNGAIGGKLVGAGGGGFLMFVTKNKNKLRKVMRELNLQEINFKFDFEGTKAVITA